MPSKDVRGIQFNRLNLPVTDFQHFTVVAEIEPIVLNHFDLFEADDVTCKVHGVVK